MVRRGCRHGAIGRRESIWHQSLSPPPHIRIIPRLSLVANNVCEWYFPCNGITRGCLRQCNQTIKHRAASFAEWFPFNRKWLDMSYSSFLSSIKEIFSSGGKCTTRSLQMCKPESATSFQTLVHFPGINFVIDIVSSCHYYFLLAKMDSINYRKRSLKYQKEKNAF